MIIYGNGKIWSPVDFKVVAEFLNGKIETDDEEILRLAKLNGFVIDGEKATANLPDIEQPGVVKRKK